MIWPGPVPPINVIGDSEHVLGFFVSHFVDAYKFLWACASRGHLSLEIASKLSASNVHYGYAKLHPEGDFPGDTATRFRACSPQDPERMAVTYVLVDGGALDKFSVAHTACGED